MSNLHKRAMEAVLQAAQHDIVGTLKEREIGDRHSEEADEAVLDVAILHAYRIFVRICGSRDWMSTANCSPSLPANWPMKWRRTPTAITTERVRYNSLRFERLRPPPAARSSM